MNFGPNSLRIKKIPTSCVRISSRPKAIIYWITNLNRVFEHDFTPLSESLAFDSSARSNFSFQTYLETTRYKVSIAVIRSKRHGTTILSFASPTSIHTINLEKIMPQKLKLQFQE